jgi:hypothetical protein
MNLGWLSTSTSAVRALLPGAPVTPGSLPASPGAFQASEPGGASAPLIWLVVLFCAELLAIWASAALFGVESAQRFCEKSWGGVTGVLGVLVPALLAYRSFNKHVAAKVAIAVAQGPQQAPASAVGVAQTVNVEGSKP